MARPPPPSKDNRFTSRTGPFGAEPFDPARDGFGFRNPVGIVPNRAGGGPLLRRLDVSLYGKGLCFGMAVASLLRHAEGVAGARRPPLAGLPPDAGLLDALRGHHRRQFRPRAVLAAVGGWLISGGGRVTGVPGGLRLAGESPDPHVLCFGPLLGYPRRFFHCLARAHAVVPYRVGERRVYVYDPNHPGDRGRYVEFRDGGGFVYGGFRSEEGWGISCVPLSAATAGVRTRRTG